ncbi:cytochrome P450 [Multifurca ochricompacta]|uniref:Cytochrome P450 n=1 Tax=Multifurca ochricompacta TaxID=376703 RepID=A0AAD4M113_9AGAM|nr:cytochrome P450 [Multifurca ochricompacta]
MSQLKNKKWLFSSDCKGRFSEVMHLDAMGRQTIIFNSLKSAFNVLERRTGNYSGRPRFIMAQEILNEGLGVILMDYGELWRRLRRAAHDAVSRTTVQNYHPTQTKEATVLVSSLLEDPQIDIICKMEEEALMRAAQRYDIFLRLFDRVRADIATGGERPSFSASLLRNHDRYHLSEPEMTFLSGQMYIAGFETTSTTLMWWTLAMVAFPQVQRRAQAELDAVVGRSRLPTFEDAPHLPYVRAVVREVLRWRPPVPFGVPHAATEDDWYEGMFIPKGATCLANIWQCNHDRAIFGEDADDFRPERHLDEGGELLPGPIETNQEGHVSLEREGVVPDTDTFIDTEFLCDHPTPYDCRIRPRFPEVVSILSEERERFKGD